MKQQTKKLIQESEQGVVNQEKTLLELKLQVTDFEGEGAIQSEIIEASKYTFSLQKQMFAQAQLKGSDGQRYSVTNNTCFACSYLNLESALITKANE